MNPKTFSHSAVITIFLKHKMFKTTLTLLQVFHNNLSNNQRPKVLPNNQRS